MEPSKQKLSRAQRWSATRPTKTSVFWFGVAAVVKDDPKRDEKLKELKQVNAWEQGDYVKKQGWATMPGEKEPESRVADECAKLLLLIS